MLIKDLEFSFIMLLIILKALDSINIQYISAFREQNKKMIYL